MGNDGYLDWCWWSLPNRIPVIKPSSSTKTGRSNPSVNPALPGTASWQYPQESQGRNDYSIPIWLSREKFCRFTYGHCWFLPMQGSNLEYYLNSKSQSLICCCLNVFPDISFWTGVSIKLKGCSLGVTWNICSDCQWVQNPQRLLCFHICHPKGTRESRGSRWTPSSAAGAFDSQSWVQTAARLLCELLRVSFKHLHDRRRQTNGSSSSWAVNHYSLPAAHPLCSHS